MLLSARIRWAFRSVRKRHLDCQIWQRYRASAVVGVDNGRRNDDAREAPRRGRPDRAPGDGRHRRRRRHRRPAGPGRCRWPRQRRSPRPGSRADPSPGPSAPRRRSQRRPTGCDGRGRTGAVAARGRRAGSARATGPRRRRPSPRRRPTGAPRTLRGGSGARGRTSSGSPTPRTGVRSTATTSPTARRASPAGGTLCSTNWTGSALISGGIGYSWFVMRSSAGFACPTRDPMDHAAPEPLPRRLPERLGQLGDRRDGLERT